MKMAIRPYNLATFPKSLKGQGMNLM